jgi:hypothetical protein
MPEFKVEGENEPVKMADETVMSESIIEAHLTDLEVL